MKFNILFGLVFLLVLSLLLTACGQPGMYDDDAFADIGIDVEDDVFSFQVTHTAKGAKMVVTMEDVGSEDYGYNLAGELTFDKNYFDVSFKQLSDWLCKYNKENGKVACASTTPVDPGEIFSFSFVSKEGTPSGNYPLTFSIFEFDSEEYDKELSTFINIK